MREAHEFAVPNIVFEHRGVWANVNCPTLISQTTTLKVATERPFRQAPLLFRISKLFQNPSQTAKAEKLVSKSEQTAILSMCDSHRMKLEIQILAVELDGLDGIVVTFSDRTTGGYVIEELSELRPVRERMKTKKIKNAPRVSC
jgi:hypothetical protein